MSFSRNLDRQRGFTLIELSIVLVIIGLIIGGVLKGQEMIESARLKATVTQSDGIKAAFNTFTDKYLMAPGDYNAATTQISATGVVNGDANGVLGAGAAGAETFDGTINEHLNFWAHLAAANLVNSVQLGTVAGTAQAANAGGIPTGKLTNTFWTAAEGTNSGRNSLYIRLGLGTAAGAPTASLTAAQAAEIDRKFDDGNAILGSIRSTAATGAATCAAATGVYNSLLPGQLCLLMIDLRG